jgi:hypothetical protein
LVVVFAAGCSGPHPVPDRRIKGGPNDAPEHAPTTIDAHQILLDTMVIGADDPMISDAREQWEREHSRSAP